MSRLEEKKNKMVLFGLNFTNQVMTRFLAVFPNIYAEASKATGFGRKLVIAYFVGYSCLGCLLFPTFYPWT